MLAFMWMFKPITHVKETMVTPGTANDITDQSSELADDNCSRDEVEPGSSRGSLTPDKNPQEAETHTH
jgi:hypothetical protein